MIPVAEILAIGTEILLGEIQDTNTQTIARALRGIGLDLHRTGTVGDNAERISQTVSEVLDRAQVVITTGGLGPTVDDATREGIASAVGAELEFRPELWEQIQERFAQFGLEPPDNNRRQAYLPAGATAIENPVGTAPAFIVESDDRAVISLPGVPAELEHLLQTEVIPYLRRRFELSGVIKSRVLRTAGVGESWLDERIGDLERLTNPTVGLAAHPGRVDIRITAKAGSEIEADEMLWGIEATLRQRLKERIYGADDETLEDVVLQALEGAGWRMALVEVGTDGALAAALAARSSSGLSGNLILPEDTSEDTALDAVSELQSKHESEIAYLVMMKRHEQRAEIHFSLRTPEDSKDWDRSYGGAPTNAPRWVVSLALDHLRRRLPKAQT